MSTQNIHTRNLSSTPHPTSDLNFKFTLSPELFLFPSPQELLQERLRKVPTAFLDKLHPKRSEESPFVEYVDEGLWKSRITFHKDWSYSAMQNRDKAEKSVHEGRTFSDLDALCEAEFKRRCPNYLKLPQKKIDKYKIQIAHSACNRDDLTCSPVIQDPLLRQQLRLQNDSLLQTDHVFAKNSPMNGQSFMRNGTAVHLTQAIVSSSDRNAEDTGNLRVVQTKDKESICYSGRPDSDRKALEQASFIFCNELKTKGKGITPTLDENGTPIYQLDYVVNSLQSTPWLTRCKSPLLRAPERRFVEEERKALIRLKNSGPLTIEDPNCPWKKYQVKLNPILFSRSFNALNRFENWLPPFLTGQSRSQEITSEGYTALKAIAQQKLAVLKQQLQKPLAYDDTQALEQKIQAVESSLKALSRHQAACHLRPEEELLHRDYLCKILDLPIVYHCKSSTDRTSISNALSSALKQWLDLKLPIPFTLTDLIKDERFKELFAANWMAGHQITRYARGGKGTVAGKKLNSKNLGLSLSRGIFQHPALASLLPERYLTPFPTSEKLKIRARYLLLLLPLAILVYIPLMAITAARHVGYIATLGKNPHWYGPDKFAFPWLPATLIFNFLTIFPDQVLNEDSPQVGTRRLLAGGKNKEGQEDGN